MFAPREGARRGAWESVQCVWPCPLASCAFDTPSHADLEPEGVRRRRGRGTKGRRGGGGRERWKPSLEKPRWMELFLSSPARVRARVGKGWGHYGVGGGCVLELASRIGAVQDRQAVQNDRLVSDAVDRVHVALGRGAAVVPVGA